MPRGISLALVIPFYNEARYLPIAMESLRQQDDGDVPIIFVDNGSTDNSAALVRRAAEVHSGRWTCIEEPTVGKFSAMAAGVDFCARELGVRYIGFLDADSYYADASWLRTCARILRQAEAEVGYIHSPYRYVGIQHLPTFAAAYDASVAVMRSLSEQVSWFANSAGSVYSARVLMQYFRTAGVTTELGLRCSLLALSERHKAYFNPGVVMTSARRIVGNAENLHAWCFYAREFYLAKDINARAKRVPDPSPHLGDLSADMVQGFFSRQAIKFACRNLIPLALFDRSDEIGERLSIALGRDLRALIFGELRPFRFRTDLVLTDHFDVLLAAVERAPLSHALAERIAQLMRSRYDAAASLTPTFQ